MRRRKTKSKKKSAGRIVWGRPRSYETIEEFEAACRKYFVQLKWDAPNIAGITVYLGISRDTWERYRKQKDFSGTISNVEALIESWWVGRLKYPGAGSIFYLKNFRPDRYKDRISGDPESPITLQITGMKISKEK